MKTQFIGAPQLEIGDKTAEKILSYKFGLSKPESQKLTDAVIRDLAKQYAERFDGEMSGDSISEYVELASLEVYPASLSGVIAQVAKKRQEFRIAVMGFIRMLKEV
jgi:hypothetical protein